MRNRTIVASCAIVAAFTLSPTANAGIENGGFDVQAKSSNGWREVGHVAFDAHITERSIKLSKVAGAAPLTVRLVQHGGTAAHVDSVTLDGKGPVSVKGSPDPLALRKLQARDFDLTDLSGGTAELTFAPSAKEATLSISARVQGLRAEGHPFQFPHRNNGGPVNLSSAFYPVDLTNPQARQLFSEYCRSGTGHPGGYTYGWVWTDGASLRIKMDFTPDDTMDGDEDYGKVYVRGPGQVREYKVSVAETQWGEASFAYSANVAYQHKIYDFEIPLAEIADATHDGTVDIALSAYGTAAAAFDSPALAFVPVTNRFQSVYHDEANQVVYGVVVGADASIVTPAYNISTGVSSSMAYDPDHKVFLVATATYATSNFNVMGQLLSEDGTLLGSAFPISNSADNDTSPSIAYDSVAKRFLVVWDDSSTMTISAQLVNSDGTLGKRNGTVGADVFQIASIPVTPTNATIAFDATNDRYLVAWSTQVEIYAQLIRASDCALTGGPVTLAQSAYSVMHSPQIALTSSNDRYLVVFQNGSNLPNNGIGAQLVDTATGAKIGSTIVVADQSAQRASPGVEWDSSSGKFLIVWQDFRDSTTEIWSRRIDHDGVADTEANLVANADNNAFPVIAFNNRCNDNMLSYSGLTTSSVPSQHYALVGSQCETTAPTVVSVAPVDGATNVGAFSPVAVTFSEAMYAPSITSSTFVVSQGATPLAGQISYSGTTATFKVDGNLPIAAQLTAKVTTGVTDVAGNNLAADYTWSFQILDSSDGGLPDAPSDTGGMDAPDGAPYDHVAIDSPVGDVGFDAPVPSPAPKSTGCGSGGSCSTNGTPAGRNAGFLLGALLALGAFRRRRH